MQQTFYRFKFLRLGNEVLIERDDFFFITATKLLAFQYASAVGWEVFPDWSPDKYLIILRDEGEVYVPNGE